MKTSSRKPGHAKPDLLLRLMRQATREILHDPSALVYVGPRGAIGRRPVNASDINCGYCEEWAERVAELYRAATGKDEVDVLDPGNITGDPDDSLLGHVFLRFRNRFYDAECAKGVTDWRQLPLFVKQQKTTPRA